MAGVSADPKIEILGPEVPGYAEILTADALKFLSQLSREFGNRRDLSKQTLSVDPSPGDRFGRPR